MQHLENCPTACSPMPWHNAAFAASLPAELAEHLKIEARQVTRLRSGDLWPRSGRSGSLLTAQAKPANVESELLKNSEPPALVPCKRMISQQESALRNPPCKSGYCRLVPFASTARPCKLETFPYRPSAENTTIERNPRLLTLTPQPTPERELEDLKLILICVSAFAALQNRHVKVPSLLHTGVAPLQRRPARKAQALHSPRCEFRVFCQDGDWIHRNYGRLCPCTLKAGPSSGNNRSMILLVIAGKSESKTVANPQLCGFASAWVSSAMACWKRTPT